MKFDIFDKSTWDDRLPVDHETHITNRAVGAIGNTMGKIAALKKKIQAHPSLDHEEYKIAMHLLALNPNAFNIMQVRIELPDKKIQSLLAAITALEAIWSDDKNRRQNWRMTIHFFEELKPYLEDTDTYYVRAPAAKNCETACNPIVTGNEAWKVYLNARQLENIWKKQHEDYKEEHPEHACNSYDDDGDGND